jgi:hypothetical protein
MASHVAVPASVGIQHASGLRGKGGRGEGNSSWPVAARGALVAGVAWANIFTFSPWKP